MDFFNHLIEASPSSELLLHLVHVYGVHLVVLCLSAMTVYRREMSCNHCYTEQDPDAPAEISGEVKLCDEVAEWDEVRTEELLESVGLYCSGASLLPSMLQVLEHFHWNPSS